MITRFGKVFELVNTWIAKFLFEHFYLNIKKTCELLEAEGRADEFSYKYLKRTEEKLYRMCEERASNL